MCRCDVRLSSDNYEVIQTPQGRTLIIRLPHWLKLYRAAHTKQLQYMGTINHLTSSIPLNHTNYHNVAVTMKSLEEYRKSQDTSYLPRLPRQGHQQPLFQQGRNLERLWKLPKSTHVYKGSSWKLSTKEPNTFQGKYISKDRYKTEPRLQLPLIDTSAKQIHNAMSSHVL